jgi:hypothetical protein
MSEWENFGKERYYWTQDHSLRIVDGLQSADSAVTEVTHGLSASFTATTGECDKSVTIWVVSIQIKYISEHLTTLM